MDSKLIKKSSWINLKKAKQETTTEPKKKLDTSKLVAEVDAFPDWLLTETATKKWYELNNLASDASPIIPWWEDIVNEENEYRQSIRDNFAKFMEWRKWLRKWIRNWTVKVLWEDKDGNNRDMEEARKSSFVDYVRNAYVNSNDLSVWEDLNKTSEQKIEKLNKLWDWADDYLLNYMINGNADYQAAYDDYKKNWWFPNNLYEYMMWRSTNPYMQETPEETKSWFNNFMSSWGATVPMEIGGAVSMLWDASWITEENKMLSQKTWDKIIQNISTEDYERYKKEWYKPIEYTWEQIPFSWDWLKKAFSEEQYAEWKSRQDASTLRKAIYDQYDKYKYNPETNPNWFRGSVEDYANYQKKVAEETYKSFWQAITDTALSTFTEWTLSADLWQMASEINQLMAWMWWKNAVSNSWNMYRTLQWFDAVPKTITTTLSLISMWLEGQALEDAYNKEISSQWEYAESVGWAIAGEWILRTMGKLWKYVLKNFAGLTDQMTNSLKNISREEWDAMSELMEQSKDPNSYKTVWREIWQKLSPIKQKLKEEWLNAGKAKEQFEKFNLWEYDSKKLAENLNTEFKWLTNRDIMGDKAWTAEAPKLTIWETDVERAMSENARYFKEQAFKSAEEELSNASKNLEKAKYEMSRAKKKDLAKAEENLRNAEEEYSKASEKYENAAKDAWVKTDKVKKAEEAKAKQEENLPEDIKENNRIIAEDKANKAKSAADLADRKRKFGIRFEGWEWLENKTDKDAVDAIEFFMKEWNNTFVTNWQPMNAANTLDVIKYVKWVLKWSEWGKNRAVRLLIQWLDITEQDLLSKVPEWYAEASQTWADKKFLNETMEEIVGKMEWRWNAKAMEEVVAWESAFNKAKASQARELFRQIKADYGIDINNYLMAWATNAYINWENWVFEVLKDIYPSLPWLMEQWLTWIKKLSAQNVARNSLKWSDTVLKWSDAFWTVIPNEYKEDIKQIGGSIRDTISDSLRN